MTALKSQRKLENDPIIVMDEGSVIEVSEQSYSDNDLKKAHINSNSHSAAVSPKKESK